MLDHPSRASDPQDRQATGLAREFSLPIKGALIGALLALGVVAYSYDYAVRHDPRITNFWYYLTGKQYRPLQLVVSLLPIAVGYFWGRSRQRLLALRALCYDAVMDGSGRAGRRQVDLQGLGTDSLTRRELEILKLVCHGLTNREIAALLFISEKTVKNHINSLFKKLQVNNRTNAVLAALGDGLVGSERNGPGGP